jgi:hypothetical protein
MVNNDVIQNLIQYISAFDTDFAKKIQGATESEIENLENLTKIILPSSYRSFLRNMGKNSEKVRFSEGVSNIEGIISYYVEYEKEMKDWEDDFKFPQNCIFISVGNVVGETSIDCNSENLRVVSTEWGDIKEVVSENFDKFLFQIAFWNYHKPIFKYERSLTLNSNVEQNLEKMKEIALRIGFKEKWFSDDEMFFGEHEKAFIRLQQNKMGNKLSINVFADAQELITDIVRHFY